MLSPFVWEPGPAPTRAPGQTAPCRLPRRALPLTPKAAEAPTCLHRLPDLPAPPELAPGHEHTPHGGTAAAPPPPPPKRSASHRPPALAAGPSPQPRPGAAPAAGRLGGHLPRPRLHSGPHLGAGGRGGALPRGSSSPQGSSFSPQVSWKGGGGITSGGPSPHGSPYLRGAA